MRLVSHEVYTSESRTTEWREWLETFQVGDVCVQCNVSVTKYIPLSHELRMDERDSRFWKCARVSRCVSDSVEMYQGLTWEWVPNTIRVPRVKHLVWVPHTFQVNHSYMLSESLIQFEWVPHTFQMTCQRDSLDIYDSRCMRESRCIQTAQKACWNPAGVEPVYCRPVDVDPGALISGTYRNRTLVPSQWYKSNKRVSMGSKIHHQETSSAIWKGLEILEMYLYNAIRGSRTIYLQFTN